MANIHALLDDLNPINDRIDGLVTGFQGAITIADTPTEDGVYFPTEEGTYPNAGGLVYNPEGDDKGKLVQFFNKDGVWTKSVIDVEYNYGNPIWEYGYINNAGDNNSEVVDTHLRTNYFSYENLIKIEIPNDLALGYFLYDINFNLLERIPAQTNKVIEFNYIEDAKFIKLAVRKEPSGASISESDLVGLKIINDNKLIYEQLKEVLSKDNLNFLMYGFIDNSGVDSTSPTQKYIISDFFDYETLIKISAPLDYAYTIHVYNENKEWIKLVVTSTMGEYEVPYVENAKYAKLSIRSSDIDNLQDLEPNVFDEFILNKDLKGFVYGKEIDNDIAMPSKMYMLEGVVHDIFSTAIQQKNKPYENFIRFSGTQSYTREFKNTSKISNPQNGSIIKTSLYSKDFEVAKSLETEVIASDKNTDNGEIIIQCLGDSFTAMGFFRDALIDKNYCPNIKMVGTRKVKDSGANFHDEGRGGWSMGAYFSVAKGNGLSGDAYAGYYQPEGVYKYWGDTRFWINAIRSNIDGSNDYVVGRFDQADRFDATTGLLTSPQQNDIMFNGDDMIIYNGSSWEITSQSNYTWSFQYDKYLSMWNIEAPEILFVMLGMNSFRKSFSNGAWNTWKNRMEKIKESYKQAVPNGKFAVVIHCTNVGISNNTYRDFAEMQDFNLFKYRKNIIAEFDNREDEDIYLLDAGIMVDPIYGYPEEHPDGRLIDRKPFDTYTGDRELFVQTYNPHPTVSYPAMSLPLAAFIQKFR